MYEYLATITRVVDGDTVHAAVDLGFDEWRNMTLRLYGINAPEMGTPEGQAAKVYLISLLADYDASWLPVLMTTHKDKREKYGRYLAELFLEGETASVNEQMILGGHAVRYLV